MNVSTILVSRDEAERKLAQYRAITDRRRVAEDDKLQSLYASVARGARVLNLAGAFKETGLNERGEPRLAIARADWRTVYFRPRAQLGANAWRDLPGGGGFSDRAQWDYNLTARNIALPSATFDNNQLTVHQLKSPVPHIPPPLRPRFALHNYQILFEVQQWQTYPVDPFLLRRIAGMLFVVEAEWELTAFEAALLGAMTVGT